MIQVNLLPDVKIVYMRTTRNKRLVIGASVLTIIVSFAVLLLLGSIVYGFQKKSLSDLNGDITTYNNQLKNSPDLAKILTVQNQLTALTSLHEQKPVAARVFSYLTQVTPSAASITQFDADFEANTMTITGTASSLDVANTYIDTLKFTKYQEVDSAGKAQGDAVSAFSDVVLSQFARNDSGATYTITLSYDPVIFSGTTSVKLSVPNIISTRSLTEQPTDLFKSGQTTGGQ
jgi:Tfp pilus assembly protein PilN